MAERHRLTVEDIWAVKRVGAPSLSPGGRRAAVDVTCYDLERNDRTADIWLLCTSGSEAPVRLTTHAARDRSPQWSPAGTEIAFISQREGDEQPQIYLISPEGGEARRLTTLSTGASSHKWFPDGRLLAFISWVWPDLATDEQQLARRKERQEAKVKALVIESTTFRFWDHWLADGRVPPLFVVDAETGECRDLLAGGGPSLFHFQAEADLSASLYDIAPDGRELVITADLGKDPGFDPNADLVSVPVEGGSWRRITDNPAHDTNPRYSPDGRWIAYTRQEIPHFYADRERIALFDRRAGTTRVLTEGWDRSAEAPVWSPDSRRLFFAAEDRARTPVWALDIEGGQPQPLVEGGCCSSIDVSRDGSTIAFLRTTMGEPPTLYAVGAQSAERKARGAGEAGALAGPDALRHTLCALRQVSHFNDDLAAGWELGEVKEAVFEGWGGNPVQMWVIHPPDFDPSKKWPLLQIVHGGPHGAWGDQFHFRWNMHLFASRGYVVAAVNFHGSTGWGQAFTDANTGQYGTKELEDVEKATDYLLGTGFIDPDRLAAAGGSFGGYMVAWMNGHTDRYKAYVCHAGVYDWVSQMASDAVRGRERALGAFPWDDPERVLGQSAHSYAQHFKTPTLVIHGELDYRVPVTQGFEFYETLRMRGVPSRLVYFPDENHWILKPQNSRLWYGQFFDWIERFVPPGGR